MAERNDFERVRRAGLRIPELEESRAWNGPCLKADRKIAAIMAVHKSAEPGSLAAVVGEDARDELIAEAPDIYYVTDHFLPWPVVLVRLAKVDEETLRGLLLMAARYRMAGARRGERV